MPAVANKKKTSKKGSKKGSRPARDDARQVAKASEGKLTTDQVRQLRALKNGKEITRDDLKIGCGMKAESLYSQKWLQGLWDLNNHKPALIHITVEDAATEGGKSTSGRRAGTHFHTITPAGKAALESAEKKAKEAAKAK